MKLFNREQLSDKANSDTVKILSISFEYLMAGISAEHSTFLSIDSDSTKQFNQYNRLDWYIMTCYPFFVSMANGNSRSLFNLFGEFYATQNGPISISIYNLMGTVDEPGYHRPFKYFKNPKGNSVGSVQTIDENKKLLDIMKEIKEEILTFENSDSLQFKDVKILNDKDEEYSLCAAIDSSISVIQKQSSGTFFDGDPRTVNYQSSFFTTFLQNFKENHVHQITYVDPQKESPFYEEVTL